MLFLLLEVAPLNGFIDPAIHIGFQGSDSLGLILLLGCGEPKVLHNVKCFSGEAELEGLDLLGS